MTSRAIVAEWVVPFDLGRRQPFIFFLNAAEERLARQRGLVLVSPIRESVGLGEEGRNVRMVSILWPERLTHRFGRCDTSRMQHLLKLLGCQATGRSTFS